MDFNDKTLTLFKSFINDIIKVFPEHNDCINKNYNEILELDELIIDENEIIKSFLDLIDEHSDKITNKKSDIFTDDLYLIKEISMKTLWDSDISDKTRENIWKYLQSFCLINISRTSNEQINNVLKSLESNEKIKDKKTVKDIKKINKINENLKKQSESSNASLNSSSNGSLSDIDNILNNTTIGSLAKEITEGLNLDNMDEEGMGNLMKPENIMNMFQKINTTLTSKLQNNELDGNSLLGEASGLMNDNDMMKNMMGMFGNMTGGGNNMPDMSGMMSMFENMNKPHEPKKESKSNGNHGPDVVKERLRKKLNNK